MLRPNTPAEVESYLTYHVFVPYRRWYNSRDIARPPLDWLLRFAHEQQQLALRKDTGAHISQLFKQRREIETRIMELVNATDDELEAASELLEDAYRDDPCSQICDIDVIGEVLYQRENPDEEEAPDASPAD